MATHSITLGEQAEEIVLRKRADGNGFNLSKFVKDKLIEDEENCQEQKVDKISLKLKELELEKDRLLAKEKHWNNMLELARQNELEQQEKQEEYHKQAIDILKRLHKERRDMNAPAKTWSKMTGISVDELIQEALQ